MVDHQGSNLFNSDRSINRLNIFTVYKDFNYKLCISLFVSSYADVFTFYRCDFRILNLNQFTSSQLLNANQIWCEDRARI